MPYQKTIFSDEITAKAIFLVERQKDMFALTCIIIKYRSIESGNSINNQTNLHQRTMASYSKRLNTLNINLLVEKNTQVTFIYYV